VYVVFRPTCSWHNWVENLRVMPVPPCPNVCDDAAVLEDASVHHGFDRFMQRPIMRRSLGVGLDMCGSSTVSVQLLGMSLGGALAPLSAAMWRKALDRKWPCNIALDSAGQGQGQGQGRRPKLECVTFGAPLFCNEALGSYICKRLDRYTRINAQRDVVPRVPFLFETCGSVTTVCDGSFEADWLYAGARSSGLAYEHLCNLRRLNTVGHGYYLGVWFNWKPAVLFTSKVPGLAFLPDFDARSCMAAKTDEAQASYDACRAARVQHEDAEPCLFLRPGFKVRMGPDATRLVLATDPNVETGTAGTTEATIRHTHELLRFLQE
jgi:hypothetical protein